MTTKELQAIPKLAFELEMKRRGYEVINLDEFLEEIDELKKEI